MIIYCLHLVSNYHIKMVKQLTAGVKSHAANGLFMCREVGHNAIAIGVLADEYLHNINTDKGRLGNKNTPKRKYQLTDTGIVL